MDLARQYGTPLYVMSEDEVRRACRSYAASFQKYYGGNGRPIYASKAFSCKEIYRIVVSEGLDVEVVSGGELYTALQAGVPGRSSISRGTTSRPGSCAMAVENGVGDIVVDNLLELDMLQQAAKEHGVRAGISLRVKPGIDAHTHEFIRTGQIDSKFGLDLQNGEALEAVKQALAAENLELQGLHCHIGSQILEKEPFVHAAEVMLDFYGLLRRELGVTLKHAEPGGRLRYPLQGGGRRPSPTRNTWSVVSAAVHRKCGELDLPQPFIYIEPGRSIVGEAGITLYTVGAIKEIPGVRNYVAIDGGMFDNPRYALYQADYTCLIANKADRSADYTATIAGKCCESGDLIQEHAPIQKPETGDILAVLSTGAYNYSMASNYNRNLKPPCVMVSQGSSRVIIKGETYEDLVRNDI